MFISTNIEKLLNFRIEQEEASSRLYLAISKKLDYLGFFGAGELWKKYSDEELKHAQWAYEFLENLDILPCVPSLEKPDMKDITCIIDAIDLSLAHEELITKQCNDLAKAANDEGDYMTLGLALRFVQEQNEELAKIMYWKNRYDIVGESSEGVYMLDKEMQSKI
jgi:ferritin